MLGLAFSEAKRSENFGLKLQQRSQNKGPQHDGPTIPNPGTGHKRTRRRRRPKKNRGGGGGDPHALAAAPLSSGSHSKKPHDAPMTKRDLYFCLRCGVVTVGTQGHDSAVGRVTLVNWENQVVLDRFVKVPLVVADYRTADTGITKEHLTGPEAITFDQARSQVGRLIKGKILIGHGLEVDLSALGLSHPWCDVRDTATYAPYMEEVTDALTSMLLPRDLTLLALTDLGRQVSGCPIKEAIACLDLYKAARSDWEEELIKLVQQNERQRQLVMSMRSGQLGGRKSLLSVPLSAIREDETSRSIGSLDPFQGYPREKSYRSEINNFEESTLATMSLTDQTTIHDTSSFMADDGSSEASSSFLSCDTSDMASTFSSSISRWTPGGRSEIENLEELNNSTSLGVGVWSSVDTNAQSTPRRQGSDWFRAPPPESPSQPVMANPSVWHPNTQEIQSLGSCPSWSQNKQDVSIDDGKPVLQQEPVTLLTEEDMLNHLPSQLLADLDEGVDIEKDPIGSFPSRARSNSVGALNHVREEPEKKQPTIWFLPRRKSKNSTDKGRPRSSSEDQSSDTFEVHPKETGMLSLLRKK